METFGPWNEARSPEMKEMIEAFKEMMTIVQFANELQGTGNITAALQNYKAALTLFTKLGNGGGVGERNCRREPPLLCIFTSKGRNN